MAGQKTINIVYNVDTSSIQVARDQVTQAKNATDQLTASAKTMGDQGALAANKYSNTIDGLKAQMAQLKAQIDLTSQSDTATLNARIAQYKEMQAQLDRYNAKLGETKTQTDTVGASMANLYTTVKTVITAGLLAEVVKVNLEMAKLSGQVEGVTRGFQRNIPGANLLLAELRTKTHGVLTDFELMQRTLLASNLGVGVEHLGTIFEFVQTRVQQTGQSFDVLLDKFIRGIGVKSPRLLDDLGISSVRLKENLDGVALSAISIGDFTTKVAGIAKEELAKMGGYVETSATKVDQLGASWDKLKITLSQIGTSTGMISFFNKTIQGAELLAKSIFMSGGSLSGLFTARKLLIDLDNATKEATRQVISFKNANGDNSQAIDEEISNLNRLIEANNKVISSNKTIHQKGDFLNLFDKQTVSPENLEISRQSNLVASKQIVLLKEYKQQLEAANKPEKDQIGLIEAIDQKIKSLNDDLQKSTSRKQIIDIQIRINELKNERADILDPDRIARENAEKAKKGQQEINKDLNEQRTNFFKDQQKKVSGFYQWLLDEEKQNNKQFLSGLKKDLKDQEQEQAAHEQRMQRLIRFVGSQIYQDTRQTMNNLVQQEVNQYDERIQNLQDYYSNQETLAGTNTKRVQQLQKEEAAKQKQLEKEKKAAQKKANIERIEIDTAANVIKSILENGGVPWGLPAGAIAAGLGLLEIGIVNKFAKGVIDLKGPGNETSDSIPSMLSRGESVMTAEETRNSMGILKSIRAKKLNDQVLEKLTVTADGITVKSDNSDVVNELRRNKHPDIIRIGSHIYEAKEHGKTQRRIIRSKSFNP